MLTIERSYDVGLIDSVLRNPSIYASMCDDSCPKDSRKITVFEMMDALMFLVVKLDGAVGGCFILEPHGHVFCAHTALQSNCRGKNAIKAGRAMLDYVFRQTECREVSSYAFSDSPHVDWFARAVGLHVTGVEDYPNTRNGKAVSITKFSILKDQFLK